MLLESSPRKILIYNLPVDMRKSFHGLVALTREVLKEDPLNGNLYVYTNRAGTMMKCLVWDRTGYVLYVKRLERGTFKIRTNEEKKEISEQRLKLLLDGITI